MAAEQIIDLASVEKAEQEITDALETLKKDEATLDEIKSHIAHALFLLTAYKRGLTMYRLHLEKKGTASQEAPK